MANSQLVESNIVDLENTLDIFKWEQLGIPYPLEGVRPPSEERINNAREILGAI